MSSPKLESFTWCLMSVKFGQRALTLVSMAFGLVATGTLALAVATDYWLWTSEPVVKETNLDYYEYEPVGGIPGEEYPAYPEYPEYDEGEYEGEEGYQDYNGGIPPPLCKPINYFQQNWKRVEDAGTTWSILRAIRKASPVVVFSLILLIIAFSLSTIGNTKKDYRTISGAVIYVFAALFLAVGVILYISGVNDEMAHQKKPAPDGSKFEYHYGWAFFFAGSSFITSLMASVTNLSLYLKRYPTIEDMANIIPGLDKKHNYNFSKVSSTDDLDVTVCSQNPTLIL